MSEIKILPSCSIAHNDQRDNPGSHGIPAGSDCWYTAAAMCLAAVGIGDASDAHVTAIKAGMEANPAFRELLSRVWPEFEQPRRLAVCGEVGAMYLAYTLQGHCVDDHVVWSPGYLERPGMRDAIRRTGLSLFITPDPYGNNLFDGLREWSPAVLSTMATPAGHYVAASGVWESGDERGLRIEDPYGRYPYQGHQPLGAGAGNLHTEITLAKMRANLGWRYAQIVRGKGCEFYS